ncbi:MAG: glycosyltransferase [Actinobacteria bacterium]|nr:glycosyltransferase [Actinomycetota bacterium]
MPESELPAAYDAMDVFALPTHTRRWGVDVEGLGIVFLEAAAAGVPILVGDSGGSVDAVQDGETGKLIGTNPEAIAAEIVELAHDEAQRREMGARGRQWMVDEWQWADRATSVSGILGGD